jgi:MarR family transcriptional regulator, temperature-dependent positive regulator of motility
VKPEALRWFQLRRASQAWTALWLDRVPDLTNPQFAVLLFLGQQGALDQSELGALASVDRSTLSVLVDRLEARGLVTKTMDPANRRRHIIELTDAGYRRLDESAEVAEDVIGQVRGHFEAEEFEQFGYAYSAPLATCPQPRCRAERPMEQKPAPMRARGSSHRPSIRAIRLVIRVRRKLHVADGIRPRGQAPPRPPAPAVGRSAPEQHGRHRQSVGVDAAGPVRRHLYGGGRPNTASNAAPYAEPTADASMSTQGKSLSR